MHASLNRWDCSATRSAPAWHLHYLTPATPGTLYKWMSGYSKDLGACKFTPDGKVITTSGANGDWKLFDEDMRMYVINIDGETRHSLKFVRGRGLVDEQGIPAFQLVPS